MNEKNFCLSQSSTKRIITISLISIIVFPSLFYTIGYYRGSQSVYFTSSSISPTIDGIIIESDWKQSNFIIEQYIDANEIEGDSDTYNYVYVGENDTNIFLSIDLCSDLTKSSDIDWIAILLNTNTTYNVENENQWIQSPYTQGLFYNLKSNTTFNNPNQYVYDIDGKKEEYDIIFPLNLLKLKYGILADMEEYPYYKFTSNWREGVGYYNDGIATMIYTEKTPYSDVKGFHLSLRFLEQILSGLLNTTIEEGTLSYMEFNASINIYDLFLHVPKEFLEYIANDLELKVNFGIIPMETYDYSQKDNLTYEEKMNSLKQLYNNPGIYCCAILNNPIISKTYNIENTTTLTELTFPIISPTDYLLGHDNLLEDGVLKKTIQSGIYPFFEGLLGNYSVEINMTDTIKKNNGWINLTVYGLNALEDVLTDVDINLGFAIDYFTISVKTSDSLNINPLGTNTIKNATIMSSFGKSANSEKEHNMIEISIPKSELYGYNEKEFKMMIIGYSGEKERNATVFGYEIKKPESKINYIFGAINSIANENSYYDTTNYYIVPMNQKTQRTEVIKNN